MNRLIVNTAALLMAMLVTGTVFGIWFGFTPFDFSATAYVEQQQQMIRALNVKMPVMGAITILLTLGSAFLARPDRKAFLIFLVAAALFMVTGFVTRFLNQPINAIVITWSAASPPETWTALRATWWSYHFIRVVSSCLGFTLLALGVQLQAKPSA